MLSTGYKEIFAPVLFWSLLPLLSMVESRTGWIQMSQMISLLTQWCLGKFKQGKTICKFTREKKIHWAKITLYRVCVSEFPKVSWKRMLCMLKTLQWSCLALLQCLPFLSLVPWCVVVDILTYQSTLHWQLCTNSDQRRHDGYKLSLALTWWGFRCQWASY